MPRPDPATDHRPYPLPLRRWVMSQTWRDLLFAHWPVPVAMLRPLIPDTLAIDTYEGMAWVGVVPFRMTGVQLRGLPRVPLTDAFPELNVRTYVTARTDDPSPEARKPGVYFFCLDAGNPLAVAVARTWYHLPYFNARMRVIATGRDLRYTSHRTHRGAHPAVFDAVYGPTAPVALSEPDTLAHWLTERYCLYTTDPHGTPYRGEIHHRMWPLQPAFAEIATNTMAAAHGITLPDIPPVLHFARRLDVVAWAIRPV